ncbi:YdcF family protein [Brevibacillus migulae]|uniref:YdcF family protein n=1 Tax=Brevibacillus migulae TaxID=1644114 RepID=UPI00106EE0B2|nr:YdcF family protein [Brevibacillus migulae]
MTSIQKRFCLTLALVVSTASLTSAAFPSFAAAEDQALQSVKNDEPTAERIGQYIDTAMHFYWHGGDLKKAEQEIFKGITLKGKYDVVENAFKEATILDPYNLDLKFSLASAQITQKKVSEALHTYQQILNLQPEHFNATLLYAVYSKVNGDEATYKRMMAKLDQIDAAKAAQFREKLSTTEAFFKLPLLLEAPDDLPKEKHAIVILGYALADDGSMQPTLVERLKTGLSVAKKYPQAKIIVTGGVPKNGVTEADAMTKWLLEQGIEKERILPENKATDTVENALFSTAILEQHGIRHVTLVSSASHIRRGMTIFTEISDYYAKMSGTGQPRTFTNVVYLDYPTLEEAQTVTKDEKLVVYRDLFRAAGIWQFPGVQR